MTGRLSCLYLHQRCFVSLQLTCFMRKDSLTSPSRNKRASCKLFHVFLTRALRTLAICDGSAIFRPKASVFCSVVLRPLKKHWYLRCFETLTSAEDHEYQQIQARGIPLPEALYLQCFQAMFFSESGLFWIPLVHQF